MDVVVDVRHRYFSSAQLLFHASSDSVRVHMFVLLETEVHTYSHPTRPAPVASSSFVSILSCLTRSVHAYTYYLTPTRYLYSLDSRCTDNDAVTRGGEIWRVGPYGWGYQSTYIAHDLFLIIFQIRPSPFALVLPSFPPSLHPTCYLFLVAPPYTFIPPRSRPPRTTTNDHADSLTLRSTYSTPVEPTPHAPADLSVLPLTAIAKNICLRGVFIGGCREVSTIHILFPF